MLHLACESPGCPAPCNGHLFVVTIRGAMRVYCAQHFAALDYLPSGAAVTFADTPATDLLPTHATERYPDVMSTGARR